MLILNIDKLKKKLYADDKIVFAYIFGSSKDGNIKNGSDIDVAVYLKNSQYNFKAIERILTIIEESTGYDKIDLVIISDVKSVVLNYEIIMGKLLFSRDKDLLAEYYSISLRKYEDEMVRWERARKYRMEARKIPR